MTTKVIIAATLQNDFGLVARPAPKALVGAGLLMSV